MSEVSIWTQNKEGIIISTPSPKEVRKDHKSLFARNKAASLQRCILVKKRQTGIWGRGCSFFVVLRRQMWGGDTRIEMSKKGLHIKRKKKLDMVRYSEGGPYLLWKRPLKTERPYCSFDKDDVSLTLGGSFVLRGIAPLTPPWRSSGARQFAT